MTDEDRNKAIDGALDSLKVFLRTNPKSILAMTFGKIKDASGWDAKLRMISLCAHGQLLGKDCHSILCEVLDAGNGGNDRPEFQWQVKISCSELVNCGLLQLESSKNNITTYCPIYLGDELLLACLGDQSEPIIATFIPEYLKRTKSGSSANKKVSEGADKENNKQIEAAKKADGRIQFAAYYAASKGMTVTPDKDKVSQLFSEFKMRLSRQGSWRNITHMLSEIVERYGVPPERMG